MRRARSGERGQALVEFALVTAFGGLLTMLAVFDVGRALYSADLVTQAARVGTRFAVVNASACTSGGTAPCETATTNYIEANVAGLDSASLQTPVYVWEGASSTCPGTAKPGCTVQVTLTYNFSYLMVPYATPTISSSSKMVISQ